MIKLVFSLQATEDKSACHMSCEPIGWKDAEIIERGMSSFISAIVSDAVSKYYAEMNIDGTLFKNDLQQENESLLEQSGIRVIIDKDKLRKFESENGIGV